MATLSIVAGVQEYIQAGILQPWKVLVCHVEFGNGRAAGKAKLRNWEFALTSKICASR